MAFLSRASLDQMGFAHVGENVLISDKASIYGANRISVGDHARIDDFCILSAGEGGIEIGRHVHIACYVSILGAGKVTLEDFCGISGRVSIYSSNDDYSGEWLTGPTVASEFTNVTSAAVTVGRHGIVGAGSVILPGVTLGEGCAIASLSLVNRDCDSFVIYAGCPARKVKARSDRLLEIEICFRGQD